MIMLFFFFSSRRRHTRLVSDWSSDVCSSDLNGNKIWDRTIGGANQDELKSLIETPEGEYILGGTDRKSVV